MARDNSEDDLRNRAWLDLERTQKMPELIARKILTSIVRDNMAAGDRLPGEALMLQQLGVGRASLREALRILETHGFIRIKAGPGGGPVITETDASQFTKTAVLYLYRFGITFREVLEARLVIEPVMARRAAAHRSQSALSQIKATAERGWETLEAPSDLWSEATEAFHVAVGAASGDRALNLYSHALVNIERARLGPLFLKRADRMHTLRVHDRIAGAIIEGDEDKAEQLSRAHLEALKRLREQDFARQLDGVVEW